MKNSIVKRFVSILLVLVMTFNCCISASAFQEGVTKLQHHGWRIELYLSKTMVSTMSAGVSLFGMWIPEPTVTKILASAGIVASQCPGGIILDFYPPFQIPTGFRWQ